MPLPSTSPPQPVAVLPDASLAVLSAASSSAFSAPTSTASPTDAPRYFIGLMSGTSMDGVDGVIASFGPASTPSAANVRAYEHVPFSTALRETLFALQVSGDNEIEREALATHALADAYASCCEALLRHARLTAADIVAIGVHGQTVRHRPDLGYTRQTNDPARLAERMGIDVIADFRSRDVAAGGQGAPLVPAFHADIFGAPGRTRVICNIGGISNISILDGRHAARGFDCGPGNALMDAWAERTLGTPYDTDGRQAAAGSVDAALLKRLLQEPFLDQAPPKSTGRDLFNVPWLDARLAAQGAVGDDRPLSAVRAADIQATLTALTATAIANDIDRYAPACETVYVCGGGARNPVLLTALNEALHAAWEKRHDGGRDGNGSSNAPALQVTDSLGFDAQQVEALAFAWLAMRFVDRLPGNLPDVTGAKGTRVLGALYPR